MPAPRQSPASPEPIHIATHEDTDTIPNLIQLIEQTSHLLLEFVGAPVTDGELPGGNLLGKERGIRDYAITTIL